LSFIAITDENLCRKPEFNEEESMKRTVVAVGLMLLLFAVAAQAQIPAPKPGPEHQKLGSFVGNWKWEGEYRASPFSPAGKVVGTSACTWFEGGFHVVCQATEQDPTGSYKFMRIRGWNPEQKSYEWNDIDSRGAMNSIRFTVSGNTWTGLYYQKVGAKPYHIRLTAVVNSPTLITYKVEHSEDGKTWTIFYEDKTMKQ
jgi:hypothetical protein